MPFINLIGTHVLREPRVIKTGVHNPCTINNVDNCLEEEEVSCTVPRWRDEGTSDPYRHLGRNSTTSSIEEEVSPKDSLTLSVTVMTGTTCALSSPFCSTTTHVVTLNPRQTRLIYPSLNVSNWVIPSRPFHPRPSRLGFYVSAKGNGADEEEDGNGRGTEEWRKD